ncbi:MAG: hypothetical protein ABIH24_09960 [Verrucomicrobiota bacterium]
MRKTTEALALLKLEEGVPQETGTVTHGHARPTTSEGKSLASHRGAMGCGL